MILGLCVFHVAGVFGSVLFIVEGIRRLLSLFVLVALIFIARLGLMVARVGRTFHIVLSIEGSRFFLVYFFRVEVFVDKKLFFLPLPFMSLQLGHETSHRCCRTHPSLVETSFARLWRFGSRNSKRRSSVEWLFFGRVFRLDMDALSAHVLQLVLESLQGGGDDLDIGGFIVSDIHGRVTRRGWHGVSFRVADISLDFRSTQERRTLRSEGKAAMISELAQARKSTNTNLFL